MDAKTTPINEKKAQILAKTRVEDVGVSLVSMADPLRATVQEVPPAQTRGRQHSAKSTPRIVLGLSWLTRCSGAASACEHSPLAAYALHPGREVVQQFGSHVGIVAPAPSGNVEGMVGIRKQLQCRSTAELLHQSP